MQVFTQLACGTLNTEFNHTIAIPNLPTNASVYSTTLHDPYSSPYFAIDPAGSHHILHFPQSLDAETSEINALPADHCSSDPNVQAGAARIQTILTTTSGVLSALTTGWWGHFGERHGRTRVLALATLGLFVTLVSFLEYP